MYCSLLMEKISQPIKNMCSACPFACLRSPLISNGSDANNQWGCKCRELSCMSSLSNEYNNTCKPSIFCLQWWIWTFTSIQILVTLNVYQEISRLKKEWLIHCKYFSEIKSYICSFLIISYSIPKDVSQYCISYYQYIIIGIKHSFFH